MSSEYVVCALPGELPRHTAITPSKENISIQSRKEVLLLWQVFFFCYNLHRHGKPDSAVYQQGVWTSPMPARFPQGGAKRLGVNESELQRT